MLRHHQTWYLSPEYSIESLRQELPWLHFHVFDHYIDIIMTTAASQITSLTVVFSTVYSDADQRKHQSSVSLAFVWGIHRDRWIPRTKGQLRGKCFHLMTSSCDCQPAVCTQVLLSRNSSCSWYLWINSIQFQFIIVYCHKLHSSNSNIRYIVNKRQWGMMKP